MTGELRIGILGAGGIAERAMVEPSREVDGVRVDAIGARDPERAEAFAERLDLPKHGDYETILSDPDIDLVYLALPPITHAAWGVRALRAGKHVLCEKPLSVNGTTAAAIAEAAAETGRRAFVGFHYRLHGFTQRLLEVIASGVLGDVERADIDFSIPHFVVKPGNIRLDGDLGGGAVMDVGCYAVDLLRAAWGEPVVESATAVLYEDDPRIDLQTDAVLRLPSGAPASVRASFLGDDKGAMSLRVSGSAAELVATSVIVPQWGATLRVTAGGDVVIDAKAAEGENSYARQLEHLVAVLADGSPSILDAERGVGTMRVVDDIYRAAGLEPR
ncbi:Gfo/Idh/MocA family oxidoreductase [Microbacterium sp. 4R-513]|uniref:Gfo/Idh/MocA family protein n=1 Tax=Microbacterium sp. 4R-513 TaxID=2567934 RepID=UPI0013E1F701|nr:Gfo/Idh/MocA family oxidoreductase [Microbacterium sp. 4R-513]QIG39190.1 Gfo/Idh/MocA family oxidoreductase [Microbacterium sp. 4R-513]